MLICCYKFRTRRQKHFSKFPRPCDTAQIHGPNRVFIKLTRPYGPNRVLATSPRPHGPNRHSLFCCNGVSKSRGLTGKRET